MFSLKKTYVLLLDELKHFKKNPMPIILAIICPIITWCILAFIFSKPIISNIPVTIVDNDNSSLSRTIIKNLKSIDALNVFCVTSDIHEAEKMLMNGETYVVVQIIKDAEKKLKTNQQADVVVFYNSAKMVYSKVSYKSIATTLLTISSSINIKRMMATGLDFDKAIAHVSPITTHVHVLENPYFNYGKYLLPGLFLSILQMSASYSALFIFRNRRKYDTEIYIPIYVHKLSYLISRLIPLFAANFITILFLYLGIFPICGVNISSGYFYLFQYSLFFCFVCMGMGAFCSIAFKNIGIGAMVLLVLNAPAFVFSGYTFPCWAMPPFAQMFASLIPTTHFLNGFYSIYLYGEPSFNGVIPLCFIGMVLWLGTVALFYRPGDWLRKLGKIIKII